MKLKSLLHCLSLLVLPFLSLAQVYTDGSGNVGIGTTTPKAKLDVTGNVKILSGTNPLHFTSSWMATPDGVSNTSEISNDVVNFKQLMIAGNKAAGVDRRVGIWDRLDIGGAGFSQALNVKGGAYISGNVGIGTSSPSTKLDVAGSTQAKGFILKDNWDNVLQSVDNGNTYHLIGSYRGWDPKAVYIAGANASTLASGYTTTTEKVYIGNPYYSDKYLSINFVSGGVGIGTIDTKGYKLAVNGDAIFTKIKVKAYGTWPDYVFSNNYKLPTLKEVEAFIQKYQHLPDVPSAREVAENGLDVGSNQAVLLKKIEELTLYAIEADKENKDLKVKLEQQQEINRMLEERLQKLEARLN